MRRWVRFGEGGRVRRVRDARMRGRGGAEAGGSEEDSRGGNAKSEQSVEEVEMRRTGGADSDLWWSGSE